MNKVLKHKRGFFVTKDDFFAFLAWSLTDYGRIGKIGVGTIQRSDNLVNTVLMKGSFQLCDQRGNIFYL